MKLLWMLQFFGVVVLILAVLDAIVLHRHGHTGINPYWLIMVFISLTVLTGILSYSNRQIFKSLLFIVSCANCFFGVTLPILLENFNILQQKSNWIHSGMMQPPEWKNTFLIFYLAAYFVSLFFIYHYRR